MLNEITTDKFLNGEVIIKQFKKGFRAGIDSVLLASTVESSLNIKVLELGAGVGTASLCLLCRLPFIEVTSIENNIDFFKLSIENKKLNSFAKNYNPLHEDVLTFKSNHNFDVVIMNPPYYKSKESNKKGNVYKLLGNTETNAKLSDFINLAFTLLKPKGVLCMIYESSRIQDVLNIANTNKWGNIRIYPIYSFKGGMASRIIVIMQKFSKIKPTLHYGLVSHNNDKSYTLEMLDILKNKKSFQEVIIS